MKRQVVLCLLAILLAATGDFAQSRRKPPRSITPSNASRPSESAGRVFIENKMGGQPYLLKTFKKTNGQAQEVFGVKIYVMEFEAEVQCTKVNHPAGTLILVGGYNIACDEIGEKHTLEGVIRFEQMEKGWRANQNPDDVREREGSSSTNSQATNLAATQASANESWGKFWLAFRAAVRKRDRAALRTMMTPDFEWTFGSEPNNPDSAFQYWNKQTWAALDKVLAQGTIPYQQGDPMRKNIPSRIAPPAAIRDYYYDWRAVFELRSDGWWRWSAFVSGD